MSLTQSTSQKAEGKRTSRLTAMRHVAVALALTLGMAVGARGQESGTDRSHWPASLSIATASPGGTYALYGEGLAQLIRDVVKIPTSTEATQGPSQNLVLVQKRSVGLSMTTLSPAWEAWNGELDLNLGVKHRDVRALFPMYEGAFQIVSLKRGGRGIGSIRDLDGKVVGIGPASATGAKYYPEWFREIGVRTSLRSGQYMNLAGDLIAGRLDAVTFASGLPNPTVLELEASQSTNIFSFDESERKKILASNPFLSPFRVLPGVYRSLPMAQETVAMWNFAIANRAMPEDLAYEIVRAVMQNNAQLARVHPAAAGTKAENIVADRFLWLHPGAVRYYRSVGIRVPRELIPPDMQ